MSALVLVRDDMIGQMKANPRLAGINISYHGGEFDLAALENYSKQAPALVIALLGFDVAAEEGVQADATWGMVALTKRTVEDPADFMAGEQWTSVIALADKGARAVKDAFLGCDAPVTVSAPKNFKATNQYDLKIDDTGIAMWGMTWDQRIELQDTAAELNLKPLITIGVKYDLRPPGQPGEEVGDVVEAEDIVDNLDV